MRILVADTIFPKGHQKLNEKLISFLSETNEVIIINNRDYYSISLNKISNIKGHKILMIKNSNNFYLNCIIQLVNSIILISRSWFIKYDVVVFFTFDTVIFPFLRIGFLNKKIYVIHHNNTDHLLNTLKLKVFKTYMNKINHIVFLSFIKDFLVKSGVAKSKIHVIKHPITIPPYTVENSYSAVNEKRITFSGLGHANDESLLRDFINYEKKTHILETNNIFVILRSQLMEYDNGKSIKIIKGYLSREAYDKYYQESDGILILYSSFFQNRFSGVVLDSLANSKRVLGTDIPVIRHYSSVYPNCCYVFHSIENLFAQIIEMDFNIPKESYLLFQNDYSDEEIKKELYEIFNTEKKH